MGLEGDGTTETREVDHAWQFEGVASSTAVDRQREKMSAEALDEVARRGGVDLVVAHQGAGDVVGRIEECRVEGGVLRVRGSLRGDKGPAVQLRERLRRGEQLGLSLGGKVTRAHWGWDGQVEGPVRHLDEVWVEHVAVCPAEQAVNPDAWVRLAR